MRSLAAKMSVALALLFVVAFSIVGALATRTSFAEAQAISRNANQLLHSAAVADVQRLYDRSRNFSSVQAVLARDTQREGRGILLLSATGRLIGSSDSALTSASLTPGPQGLITIDLRYGVDGTERFERLVLSQPLGVIRSNGRIIAQLFPMPHAAAQPSLVAANRRFLIGLAIVGALTLGCGYFLAQYFLDPIRRLTKATDRLRGGSHEPLHIDRDDELGDLARTFNALSSELERASRQRRELIADIAHELRSPLTNIRCAIEELQDVGGTVSEGALKSLHDDALQLQYLITDLHDLSMADAHALPLHQECLDLNELIAVTLRGFTAQAAAKGVRLHTHFSSGSLAVTADGTRVRQIAANLLSNAIRATPAGGTITVGVTRRGDAASVSVQDSGPGFDPQHRELLFERFFRAEPSRSRQTGGSGLGLALCRQLVKAHGGDIYAENTPHGALFTFTLPLTEYAATGVG